MRTSDSILKFYEHYLQKKNWIFEFLLGKYPISKNKSYEMDSRKWSYDHFKINKISMFFRKRSHGFQSFIQNLFGYCSLQEDKFDMCGHLNDAYTSSYPCRHLHIQWAQTCTIARSSYSEGHSCLATSFVASHFILLCIVIWGGGFLMRFSLFPHLFQCIFCIWVPNMAFLLGPILYFHHSDVQGGVGVTSHTPRIYFF